ncbi:MULTISPECIES: hypothetical protein [unclassified Romboutsia]|uniref:hypothetical protein n=1 Tax=unclassified Romboutsia TaxID=2626894 RepID=UPI000F06EC42|nr:MULTISPECIES: hypothetical protein [unclassified Romboutsia]
MKFSKKIYCGAIIGSLLLGNLSTLNAYADGYKEVKVDNLQVYTDKNEVLSKETPISSIEYKGDSLNIINAKSNENIIFHNDGKPIETNLFEDKQGNELFAVSLDNENGQNIYTYHMADTDEVNINDTISKIQKEEFNVRNTTRALTGDGMYSEGFKWDFYATINGAKQQQGSLSTSVLMKRDRASSNTQSIWSVEESSQLLSRSNREIKNHVVRMDVNQSTQILHDWGPRAQTNGDKLSVSLGGLSNPKSWSFSIKGFGFVDHSRQGSKYGRWEFINKGIYPSRELNVKPGITVTNKKGNLIVKLSQTVQFSKSSHQTGVITITEPDFK